MPRVDIVPVPLGPAPLCEPDDGPLTAAQLRRIKRIAPQRKTRSVRSSLLGQDARIADGPAVVDE